MWQKTEYCYEFGTHTQRSKLDAEHGKTFLTLFENRQSGDYEDFVYCDLNLFNQLKPKTLNFIEAIKHLVPEGS